MQSHVINKPIVRFAQFSDCHLFQDRQQCHHGANVYQNLYRVIDALKQDNALDFIVFTGDLTQDHTEQSYQRFVEIIQHHQITVPIYFVAGNHDNLEYLNQFLKGHPFQQQKLIETPHWQLFLLDSTTALPEGEISAAEFERVEQQIKLNKHQMFLFHHHPRDVGYFIDKHHLTNASDLVDFVTKHGSIKGLACGHVHRATQLTLASTKIPIYSCPATSIQFDPKYDGVKALTTIPGFQLFTLNKNGTIKREVVMMPNKNNSQKTNS